MDPAVVDDDVRMREALRELFTSLNMSFATFSSVAEYLAYTKPDLPACLILDVKLPDINGLDFQRQLGDSYQPDLMTAIEAAIARDRSARQERSERARLLQRYASLTPRESQVLPLIVSSF